MELTSWFHAVILPVLTSVGVSITALAGTFKFFGQKWIEGRINEAQQKRQAVFNREQQQLLEAFKGEQQKELERLRNLLNTRIGKVHEKEFNFLSEA